MQERFHDWITTIGSAALVAFIATCVDAPTVATYTCEDDAADNQRCQLADTFAARPILPVDVNDMTARAVSASN